MSRRRYTKDEDDAFGFLWSFVALWAIIVLVKACAPAAALTLKQKDAITREVRRCPVTETAILDGDVLLVTVDCATLFKAGFE